MYQRVKGHYGVLTRGTAGVRYGERATRGEVSCVARVRLMWTPNAGQAKLSEARLSFLVLLRKVSIDL